MTTQVETGQATLTAGSPTQDVAMRAEVGTVYGDTVTVGPVVRVMVSTDAEVDMRVSYSRDGGATWIDRGTVDRLQPGIVHVFRVPSYGSDVRLRFSRVSVDATVQWHSSTRPT